MGWRFEKAVEAKVNRFLETPIVERKKRSETADPTTLPHFPVLPDSVLSETQMNDRAKRLEKWLRSVLAIPINREYHETVCLQPKITIMQDLGRILGCLTFLIYQRAWRQVQGGKSEEAARWKQGLYWLQTVLYQLAAPMESKVFLGIFKFI